MRDAAAVARAIVAAVVRKHGKEVWIGEGYVAHDDLVDRIAAALRAERERTAKAVEGLEEMRRQMAWPSLDTAFACTMLRMIDAALAAARGDG